MAAPKKMYKKMYNILDNMMESSKYDDPEKVSELNNSFRKLIPKDYSYPDTKLDFLYENCRQSCVMAKTMPSVCKEFLKDAGERFSKIPKPK